MHFRSKIWKYNGFVAYNRWKQVTLCVHQRFWQIYVSQNKKQKQKNCLQSFSSKNVLTEHKVCLSINGIQSVKLEKGTIEFKNYFKQIPDPFKIYSDFQCILKSVESYEISCSKKYQSHVRCSFAYKVVCIDYRFSKPIVVYRGENSAYKFILKQLLALSWLWENEEYFGP